MAKAKKAIKVNCTFEGEKFPMYQKEGDSGMDLHAYKCLEVVDVPLVIVNEKIIETPNPNMVEVEDFKENGFILNPFCRVLIQTGLKGEFPQGIGANIKPRSGMALKFGLVAVLGTIDENYRGDIGIILSNTSNRPYRITYGERFGQIEFTQPIKVELVVAEDINETNRGETGFGASGRK